MLCLGKENSSKCSETDGFSYGFNDGMRKNIGNFLTAYCFLSADAFFLIKKLLYVSSLHTHPCMCVKYVTSTWEFKKDGSFFFSSVIKDG